MNSVAVIDQFTNVFTTYIDSGFGLLRPEVAFLTAVLVVLDMTLAGLFWAMGGETDVIARLIRKTLYVGSFAFIINNFKNLALIMFNSFAGLGLQATGSAVTYNDFLQPGRLAMSALLPVSRSCRRSASSWASSASSTTSFRSSSCSSPGW